MTEQPSVKPKSKVLNAKECKSLLKFLNSDWLNDTILAVVKDDLEQQLLADNYNQCSVLSSSEEQNITVLNLKELPVCNVTDTKDVYSGTSVIQWSTSSRK